MKQFHVNNPTPQKNTNQEKKNPQKASTDD